MIHHILEASISALFSFTGHIYIICLELRLLSDVRSCECMEFLNHLSILTHLFLRYRILQEDHNIVEQKCINFKYNYIISKTRYCQLSTTEKRKHFYSRLKFNFGALRYFPVIQSNYFISKFLKIVYSITYNIYQVNLQFPQ